VSAVDPVTLEVVRNALVGAAEEAGAALRRTAYSPTSRSGSTAPRRSSTRRRGWSRRPSTSRSTSAPCRPPSTPRSPRSTTLDPGDQVLVSDPYAGGTHLPDWTLVAPVHDPSGVLLGYAATARTTRTSVGRRPGRCRPARRRSSPRACASRRCKLYVAGEESRDIVALLLANTRTPRERLGDLRAQVGANHLAAATRLRALAADLGVDGLRTAMAGTLDHAERSVRAALRRAAGRHLARRGRARRRRDGPDRHRRSGPPSRSPATSSRWTSPTATHRSRAASTPRRRDGVRRHLRPAGRRAPDVPANDGPCGP
jgi:N-methylhydantoinase B